MSGRSASRNLPALVREHDIPTGGVLHVGANRGQEVDVYRRAGFGTIRLVEPIPELAARLRRLAGVQVIQAAAGRRGERTLHVTDNDRYASLLPPQDRRVVARVTVPVIPVRDMQGGCSLLVVDAQGAEAEVLATADLPRLRMIVVETCTRRRYKGAALRGDVLGMLDGWRLVAEFRHRTPGVSDCVLVAP